jgi:hypothetical protein
LQHFQRKPGILILNLYLYSIKIQTNIRQNFDRKIHGKVTDFFERIFLVFFWNCFWTRPNHFSLGWRCPSLVNNGELSSVHTEQWRMRLRKKKRRRKKGGGLICSNLRWYWWLWRRRIAVVCGEERWQLLGQWFFILSLCFPSTSLYSFFSVVLFFFSSLIPLFSLFLSYWLFLFLVPLFMSHALGWVIYLSWLLIFFYLISS